MSAAFKGADMSAAFAVSGFRIWGLVEGLGFSLGFGFRVSGLVLGLWFGYQRWGLGRILVFFLFRYFAHYASFQS